MPSARSTALAAITGKEKTELLKRLWEKTSVDPVTGCWIWGGARNASGYGTLSFRDRAHIASRLSLAIIAAPGTERPVWVACHKCDNPPCWNPEHLWAGTHLENHNDKVAKGRARVKTRRVYDVAAQDMCRLYYAQGWTLSEIAKDYGLTANDVDYAIQALNRSDAAEEWTYVRSMWKRRNDE